VKSLDERIDQVAGDLEDLTHKVEELTRAVGSHNSKLDVQSSQLATVIANQNATQTKLDVTNVKLEGAIEQLKVTNTRIDAVTGKMEAMTTDYTSHKAKAETMFAFTKWIGSFVAGVFLTGVIAALSVVRTAGGFEATLQQQQKALDGQQNILDQQQKTLDEIKRDVSEIRSKQK
jgi:peptidoglycan hydrolase CwlO-like protein